MNNLQRYLQDVANARRSELIPYVFNCTASTVQLGPFAGLRLLPTFMWGDGDIVAKLMGIYEDELHKFVEDAIRRNPNNVINIGSAEGYYSLGFAKRLPTASVLAVDIDPRSAGIVRDTASANGITTVTALTQLVDTAWLQNQCSELTKPLLVLDCEGAEIELLDLNKVPALAQSTILVECHDCVTPGITATLQQRFQDTHIIQYAEQTTKNPYQFSWTRCLSDCDKLALIHEGRPSTMTWLYMVPRQ